MLWCEGPYESFRDNFLSDSCFKDVKRNAKIWLHFAPCGKAGCVFQKRNLSQCCSVEGLQVVWVLFSPGVTAAPAPDSHSNGDLGLPVCAGSCGGSVLSLCHVLYHNVSFGTGPVFNKVYLFLSCFLSKYCALTQKWATITAAVSGFLYVLGKDSLRNFLIKQQNYQKRFFLPKRAKSTENRMNVRWNSVPV